MLPALGVANRAKSNVGGIRSQNIVAICDIDDRYLDGEAKKSPNAKKYNDFLKMLEQKDIAAVVVSTADHMHAPASVAAMKLGKHVYCEKLEATNCSEAAQYVKREYRKGWTL